MNERNWENRSTSPNLLMRAKTRVINGNLNGITLELHRSFIFSILFSIFTIAFILSPYWIIESQIGKRYLFLLTSTSLGLSWGYLSSGKLKLQLSKEGWLWFVIFIVVIWGLNFGTLFSAIPWRGDEDYHIRTTLALWTGLKTKGMHVAALFMLFLFIGWWRRSKLILFSALVLVGLIVLIITRNQIDLDYGLILRYPFISKWFSMSLLYFVAPFTGVYNEASYRVVPFISAIAIAWYCSRKLSHHNKIIGLAFGIAVGTIPLIYYYSSILYLEMPVVLLMIIVFFGAKELLQESFEEVRRHPAWYALILVGFIKETTLPFLLSFLLCRLLIRFWSFQKEEIHAEKIIEEAEIIFCVTFPLLLYLFYRLYYGEGREFSPTFLNLLDIGAYLVMFRSFWDQFGIFTFLLIGGCGILIIKKEYRVLLFMVTAFVAELVFHLLDEMKYVGYSRFNLFFSPIFVLGTYLFLDFIKKKNLRFIGIILIAIAVTNFTLTPININGTKKPMWGSYLFDTAEHYYPYPKAISWLKENHNFDKIRFTGLYYRYLFDFYFEKYGWFPSHDIQYTRRRIDESTALEESLAIAEKDKVPVVLYHMIGNDMPKALDLHGFTLEKVFTNRVHRLLLYSTDKERADRLDTLPLVDDK